MKLKTEQVRIQKKQMFPDKIFTPILPASHILEGAGTTGKEEYQDMNKLNN